MDDLKRNTNYKISSYILKKLAQDASEALDTEVKDKDKDDPKYPGTVTIIQLKKSINYEKINL